MTELFISLKFSERAAVSVAVKKMAIAIRFAIREHYQVFYFSIKFSTVVVSMWIFLETAQAPPIVVTSFCEQFEKWRHGLLWNPRRGEGE